MEDERIRGECRSCPAPIEWAISEKSGKKLPLDFDPVEPGEGNIRVVFVMENGTPIVRYVPGGDRISHFATCPEASKHRTK